MLEIDLIERVYHLNGIEFYSYYYYRSACITSHGRHIVDNTKNLAYRIDLLWSIEKDLKDMCQFLFWTLAYLLYLDEHKALTFHIFTYTFDVQNSIIQTLRNTIGFIINAEPQLPFAQEILPSLLTARDLLNQFAHQDHYLPHLSGNKETHTLAHILLYIQYVYEMVTTIHTTALQSLEFYEEDYRDLMPRHELLAKDVYKNRFKPMILRCD